MGQFGAQTFGPVENAQSWSCWSDKWLYRASTSTEVALKLFYAVQEPVWQQLRKMCDASRTSCAAGAAQQQLHE